MPARVVMTPEDSRIAACLVLEELASVAAWRKRAGHDEEVGGRAGLLVPHDSQEAARWSHPSAHVGPPAKLLLPLTASSEASLSKAARLAGGTAPADATTGVHAESASGVFCDVGNRPLERWLELWGLDSDRTASKESRQFAPQFAAELVRGLTSVWDETADSIAAAGAVAQPWHVQRLVLVAGLLHRVVASCAPETVALRAHKPIGNGKADAQSTAGTIDGGAESSMPTAPGLSAGDMAAGCLAGRVSGILGSLLRMAQSARAAEDARRESGVSAKQQSALAMSEAWRRLEGVGVLLGVELLSK